VKKKNAATTRQQCQAAAKQTAPSAADVSREDKAHVYIIMIGAGLRILQCKPARLLYLLVGVYIQWKFANIASFVLAKRGTTKCAPALYIAI